MESCVDLIIIADQILMKAMERMVEAKGFTELDIQVLSDTLFAIAESLKICN